MEDEPSAGSRIDWDAAFVCLTWAGLALLGWNSGGPAVGLAMLFGPLPVMMAVTWYFLVVRNDLRATRIAHWAVLAAVTVALVLYLIG